MKELISEQQAHQIVVLLSVLVTLGSIAWAAWASRRKGADARRTWAYGWAFAALGPLLFALWVVYNAIEDHYGLDSVKALLINLVLFLIVGFAAGLVFRRIPRWAAGGRATKRR